MNGIGTYKLNYFYHNDLHLLICLWSRKNIIYLVSSRQLYARYIVTKQSGRKRHNWNISHTEEWHCYSDHVMAVIHSATQVSVTRTYIDSLLSAVSKQRSKH